MSHPSFDRARTCELPFHDRVTLVIGLAVISTGLKSIFYRLLYANLCTLAGTTPEGVDPWRHVYTALFSTIAGLLLPVLNQLDWEILQKNVEAAWSSIHESFV